MYMDSANNDKTWNPTRSASFCLVDIDEYYTIENFDFYIMYVLIIICIQLVYLKHSLIL